MTKRQINEPPTGYASSTWWSRGYQAAMHDLAQKFAEGGADAAEQWIRDNTVAEFDAATLSPRPEPKPTPKPTPKSTPTLESKQAMDAIENAAAAAKKRIGRLTPASVKLFTALVEDSGNWSGMPLVDVTKEERGNLTQLKRAKLLTTETDDGATFAVFTEDGLAFARQLGIDARTVDFLDRNMHF